MGGTPAQIPASGDSGSPRLWIAGLLVGALACLLVVLLPVGSPARVVLLNATSIAAAGVFLVAILRMPRAVRVVWWGLWAYLVLTVIGDIVYDVFLYHFQEEPFPSAADVFYLTSYVALIWALVILVKRRQPHRSRETWIDTAVMTLAAACVVATVVVVPILNDTSTLDWATAVALAYPLLDVVALSALIRLLVEVKRIEPALALLTAAITAMLTADLVFQSLAAQGLVEDAPAWVDALFLAAILLLTAAATARGATTITHPNANSGRTKARLVGLAIAALTAPTLLTFSVWNEVGSGTRLLALSSIAIILLILWGALLLISMIEQQSSLLADLARRDGLTGLPNRRTLEFELDRAATRTQEQRQPFTVAIMDLDHFKQFNDHFGHPAGDRMLIQCSRAWHALLDPPAMLARYGGEEFAVLLPGISLEQAHPILERLRRATPASQTVSIGYAQRRSGEKVRETVERADKALYEAKAAGRDRVVASAEEPRGQLLH
jgi:diguanylate cyclase (GGDEF)-like protein